MSMQNKPRGRGGDEHSRVVAVLGPTNTGKTYLAIERLTGMQGFETGPQA
jgi:KaiC/GvpD/RAD55 family RecA-like ATPase